MQNPVLSAFFLFFFTFPTGLKKVCPLPLSLSPSLEKCVLQTGKMKFSLSVTSPLIPRSAYSDFNAG